MQRATKIFHFEEQETSSPFIDAVWRTRSAPDHSFISIASAHWLIVVWKQAGQTHVTVRGPETTATAVPIPPDAEFMGISVQAERIHAGLAMPGGSRSDLSAERRVIEDPVGKENSGLGDWTGPFSRGPEGDQFKLEELRAADCLIFGRTTYDAFAAVWPHVKDDTGLADRMNRLPKYLASSTLEQAAWGETTIWSGDIVSAAKALKAEGHGEALIYGSASVVHQLAGAGLIDAYNLMVYPTILGAGKRLYPDGIASQLQLSECKQFGGGIVLLRYAAA